MKTPLPSEIYGTAPDGTVLNWRFAVPSGTGPWTAAIVIHVGGFRAGHAGPTAAIQDLAAAGFIAFGIEHHLAPPANDLPQQRGSGFYPTQTDDVKMAIRAARSNSRCNGKVVGIGGSSGGSHVVYCCSTGTPGDDKFDVGSSLSGAYAYNDAASLNDPLRKSFKKDVINYVNSSDLQRLHDASPVNFVNPDMSWVKLFETNNDPMPPSQLDALTTELQSKGITNYTSTVINEPNQPDGFTRHAFQYWPDVKDEVTDFLKFHL